MACNIYLNIQHRDSLIYFVNLLVSEVRNIYPPPKKKKKKKLFYKQINSKLGLNKTNKIMVC